MPLLAGAVITLKRGASMKAYLIMTGFILSWLVSPESLAISGRMAGLSGRMALVPLAAALGLAALCTALIHDRRSPEGRNELASLSPAYGRTAASAMVMTGRIPVLLFASTAMLVSAGFAFNEIFVYWFPNFLFASLLLALVCGLPLFHEKAVLWGQTLFTGIAVLGLLILMVMGMGREGPEAAGPAPSLSRHLFGMAFLLFLGFDFYRPGNQRMPAVYITFVPAFALTAGWVLLAVALVPLPRLAGSSLPHLLVARAAGGDTGGYVIGAVIISGALSGVNGLLLALRRTLSDLAGKRLLPKTLAQERPPAILAFILIETMMMAGVAGNERIDAMVRASLILWMIYLGLRCFAARIQGQEFSLPEKCCGSLAAGLILFLAGALIMGDSDFGYILRFQVSAISFF
nr:hypothetical protein [Desulfobacula sp.]